MLSTFNTSKDTVAPTVILVSPEPATATPQNLTIQGRVLDNLSGVTALRVAVDNGAFVPVAIDAAGNFTLSTTFALNGSADGPHVFQFEATDFAGNVSVATELPFTLDTRPAPRLPDSATATTIAAARMLLGASDPTGSTIVSLSYAIDGGLVMPMTFDPSTGEFEEALDFSKLAAGSHTLVVTTRDAAGNTTQKSSGFSACSRRSR